MTPRGGGGELRTQLRAGGTAGRLEERYDADHTAPFFHPGVDSPEIEYMLERRKQLGGFMPHREVKAKALKLPGDPVYSELKQGSGKNKIATTMALVRLLKDWMKDPEIGKRIAAVAQLNFPRAPLS